TNVIELESANFDFIAIRKSQSAAKVFTDSSARFSRGVDPAMTTVGIRRVLKLLEPTSPDLRVAATGDTSVGVETPWSIPITLTEVNASLGTSFSADEVIGLLDREGLRCRREGERLVVDVTSAREDVRLACDVLEEIARLAGYDRLPETMPV